MGGGDQGRYEVPKHPDGEDCDMEEEESLSGANE